MKKVSVILPCYNRAYCIANSIYSVLEQTYSELELIIIDDGSDDNTFEIVSGIKDSRIVYKKLQKNQGVCVARNVGMSLATGDYLAFQDSDDFWIKNKLALQLEAMESSNADFCYTYIKHISEHGSTDIIPPIEVNPSYLNGDIFSLLLSDNAVGVPTLLMRRECYDVIGGFDSLFPALEDYDYALRLAQQYRAVFVPECLLEARYSKVSISRNVTNYLMASCLILAKYKKDFLQHNYFETKVMQIFEESNTYGIQDVMIPFMEKCLKAM